MDGWAGDETCLARQTDITGSALPLDDITHYATTAEAADAVKNGKV